MSNTHKDLDERAKTVGGFVGGLVAGCLALLVALPVHAWTVWMLFVHVESWPWALLFVSHLLATTGKGVVTNARKRAAVDMWEVARASHAKSLFAPPGSRLSALSMFQLATIMYCVFHAKGLVP